MKQPIRLYLNVTSMDERFAPDYLGARNIEFIDTSSIQQRYHYVELSDEDTLALKLKYENCIIYESDDIFGSRIRLNGHSVMHNNTKTYEDIIEWLKI